VSGLRQAVEIVPTPPVVATTETDRDGQYEFAEVLAAGRYRMVGVKLVEGAEPLVVGITEKLKAGERVTLNLSANSPWTRDATP
jgi:multidrug efflux pump subunit AcrA (membrane-fusion protein)